MAGGKDVLYWLLESVARPGGELFMLPGKIVEIGKNGLLGVRGRSRVRKGLAKRRRGQPRYFR